MPSNSSNLKHQSLMMLKIGPFECHENREVRNKGSQHNEEFNMVSIESHAVLVMSLIHIHYFRHKQVCHFGLGIISDQNKSVF